MTELFPVEGALRRVAGLLSGHAYQFRDEVRLHEAIAKVLGDAGLVFTREHIPTDSPRDRLDFSMPEGLAIEVKIKGTLEEAIRQAARYAKVPSIKAVLIASTRHWARGFELLPAVEGKPIAIVKLRRMGL